MTIGTDTGGKEIPGPSSLAITSLLFGIFSLAGFYYVYHITSRSTQIIDVFVYHSSLLWGIPAVLCGHSARHFIQKSRGRLSGKGLALAGLIMAYLGLAGWMVKIAPSHPERPNRNLACIDNLRMIDGAKGQWALANHKTETDAPVWKDLVGGTAYIKTTPVCPKGGVYSINNMATLPTCTIPRHELPP